jgi:hypothetical protein
MRQAHIAYAATDLNYPKAALLAADLRTRWHDYGESHGGKLEIDVGNEYLCQTSLLSDRLTPMACGCVALDDWTSKLT